MISIRKDLYSGVSVKLSSEGRNASIIGATIAYDVSDGTYEFIQSLELSHATILEQPWSGKLYLISRDLVQIDKPRRIAVMTSSHLNPWIIEDPDGKIILDGQKFGYAYETFQKFDWTFMPGGVSTMFPVGKPRKQVFLGDILYTADGYVQDSYNSLFEQPQRTSSYEFDVKPNAYAVHNGASGWPGFTPSMYDHSMIPKGTRLSDIYYVPEDWFRMAQIYNYMKPKFNITHLMIVSRHCEEMVNRNLVANPFASVDVVPFLYDSFIAGCGSHSVLVLITRNVNPIRLNTKPVFFRYSGYTVWVSPLSLFGPMIGLKSLYDTVSKKYGFGIGFRHDHMTYGIEHAFFPEEFDHPIIGSGNRWKFSSRAEYAVMAMFRQAMYNLRFALARSGDDYAQCEFNIHGNLIINVLPLPGLDLYDENPYVSRLLFDVIYGKFTHDDLIFWRTKFEDLNVKGLPDFIRKISSGFKTDDRLNKDL